MKHRIVFLERESIRGTFRQPDFPHDYDEYPLSAA
jgi:glycerate dehydrogenase